MFCKKCGKEVEENVAYCPFCGEFLNGNNDIKSSNEKMKISINVKRKPRLFKAGVITNSIGGILFPIFIMMVLLTPSGEQKEEDSNFNQIATINIDPITASASSIQMAMRVACIAGVIIFLISLFILIKRTQKYLIPMILSTIATVVYTIAIFFIGSATCCLIVMYVLPLVSIVGCLLAWIGLLHEKD